MSTEVKTEDGQAHRHDKHFFFGQHRLEAPHHEMTVSDLKHLIHKNVPDFKKEHTLVLEEHGDRPDRALADNETVHIRNFPHFYDQPPANFGA
jgi:hypothetical protein